MSGRYVVLEFDDSDSAESFTLNENLAANLAFKSIGVFIKPEKFCQCPDKKRQTVKNWARGKRTGLWLCKTCRRPSVYYQKGIKERLLMVFGYNLMALDVEEE